MNSILTRTLIPKTEAISKLLASRFFEASLLTIPIFIIVFISKSFGLAWDEPVQRLTGAVNLKYIASKIGVVRLPASTDAIPSLGEYGDRYFGPIYEMFLLGMEYLFNVTDSEHLLKGDLQTYQFRHLVTALLCYLMSVFGYFLIRDIYGKSVGFLILFLYWSFPRIFADSFYNSKDAVVASGVLLLFYLAFRFEQSKSYFRLVSFCITAGILCSIRLPMLLVVLVLFWTMIFTKASGIRILSISFFTFLLSLYLSWPFLWSSPIANISEAFRDMMSRNWNGEVLFFGENFLAESLPWNYLIGWIFVTVPLLCLTLSTLGLFMHASRVRFKQETGKQTPLSVSRSCIWIFFLANLYFVALRPTIYDGWRHFYFLYPVMVLMSPIAVSAIIGRIRFPKLGLIGLFTLILFSHAQTITLFPNGNLYFNPLISKKNLETRMEIDYWGLANRRILNSISNFAKDSGAIGVSIAHNNYNPIESSVRMLNTNIKFDFVNLSDRASACLFVTNFRIDPGIATSDFKIVDRLHIGPYSVAAIYANRTCYDKWKSFQF